MCNFQAETGPDTSPSMKLIWSRENGRVSTRTGPNMDHTYETSSGT